MRLSVGSGERPASDPRGTQGGAFTESSLRNRLTYARIMERIYSDGPGCNAKLPDNWIDCSLIFRSRRVNEMTKKTKAPV